MCLVGEAGVVYVLQYLHIAAQLNWVRIFCKPAGFICCFVNTAGVDTSYWMGKSIFWLHIHWPLFHTFNFLLRLEHKKIEEILLLFWCKRFVTSVHGNLIKFSVTGGSWWRDWFHANYCKLYQGSAYNHRGSWEQTVSYNPLYTVKNMDLVSLSCASSFWLTIEKWSKSLIMVFAYVMMVEMSSAASCCAERVPCSHLWQGGVIWRRTNCCSHWIN